MALTNNEKQIRHKKLEELKKYGNEILLQTIMKNNGQLIPNTRTNEDLKRDIETITNLPSGWTNDDFNSAVNKLKNYQNQLFDNPHLLKNDINSGHFIAGLKLDFMSLQIAESKAPEVVNNIKSTLRLSDLNTSDQIAVIAEVMRQLAKTLLQENRIPKTFANATALSLIGHQYDKPEWTWNILARNLYTQNAKENTDKLILELQKPGIENWGFIFNE